MPSFILHVAYQHNSEFKANTNSLRYVFPYHHLIKAARRQSWYYTKEKCFISPLITILVCIEGSNVPTTYLYSRSLFSATKRPKSKIFHTMQIRTMQVPE